MEVNHVPYGVQLRYSAQQGLSAEQIQELATDLDTLLKAAFKKNRETPHLAGFLPERADNSTVEVCETWFTDPRPRIEIQITCAHHNSWNDFLDGARSDIVSMMREFVQKSEPGSASGAVAPVITLRWCKTSDDWRVFDIF